MALTTRLPSARVEPFYGFVETTGDALRLIQAARQGIIPRITRRLNDLERRAMIRSGAIFIFSDEESGIKRWTEGLSWSASRIVGNFLVYREVSDRSSARTAAEGRRSTKRRGNNNELSAAELAEQKLAKALVGCLSDGSGRFKPHGLVKKTITVNVDGSDHHLIAYYNQDDVRLGKLLPLASRSDIMTLEISSELLESTKFRIPPIMHEGPDGRPRYICDAEDGDIPRHPNVPFPSTQKVPAFQRTIQQYEVRSDDSSIYEDLLRNDMAVQATFHQPHRLTISPSPHSSLPSNFFNDSFGLSDARSSRGVPYLPNSIDQSLQFEFTEGSPQELTRFSPINTFGGPTKHIADGQPIAPSILLATQGNLGTFTEVTESTHDLSFRRPGSAEASLTLHADFPRPTWALPCSTHHLPLSHSSVPTTPTQSRCAQRSTSLPSLYECRDFNMSPPISHARFGSSPVAAGFAISQADASGLLHAMALFPTET